jgi:pimeloyl-ACP methyl ester carboxylesterase
MPFGDDLYRIRTLRTTRRQVLKLAVVAGGGLAGILILGCGGDEEEKEEGERTPTVLPATVAPSGFFDSDGVKIHYETWGQGKPIILLHGFLANLNSNWVATNWVDTLQPIRRVVALDMRAHGQSDKPHDPEAYGQENMAGDVLRLMDHLGIDKADLFGYSLGSGISSYLLARHRERFTSVILGGTVDHLVLKPAPSGEQDNAIADGLLAEDPSQITDPAAQGFRAFAELDPENDLRALAACVRRAGSPIEPAELADVDIPVLIVVGANDVLVNNPEGTAAAIPGAKLVIIPDTDHLSAVPDQRFKDEVVAFLEEQ